MKPSDVFVATTDQAKGAILLSGKERPFTFIGASCPTSLGNAFGQDKLHSIALFPEQGKGKKGMVAVRAYHSRGKHDGDWYDFMLEFGWTDVPFISLGNLWIPSAERPGQLVGNAIHLQFDDGQYSTADSDGETQYMPDANLACRYLVGGAKAEEVATAAEEAQRRQEAAQQEQSAQEQLTTLQAEYAEFQQLLERRMWPLGPQEPWIPEVGKLLCRFALQQTGEHEIRLMYRSNEQHERSFQSIAVITHCVATSNPGYISDDLDVQASVSNLPGKGMATARTIADDGVLFAFARLWGDDHMSFEQLVDSLADYENLDPDEIDRLRKFV